MNGDLTGRTHFVLFFATRVWSRMGSKGPDLNPEGSDL